MSSHGLGQIGSSYYVHAFVVHAYSFPGYLSGAGVHDTRGVVRLSNFSLIKFFHNKCYSRKNFRETNIIQSV